MKSYEQINYSDIYSQKYILLSLKLLQIGLTVIGCKNNSPLKHVCEWFKQIFKLEQCIRYYNLFKTITVVWQ